MIYSRKILPYILIWWSGKIIGQLKSGKSIRRAYVLVNPPTLLNTTFFRDNQSIYLTFVILRWFSNNKSKHRWNATSCAEWRSCWRLYHLVVKLCNTFVHVYHSHIIFRPQKREPFLSFSQALLQLFVLRTATIATCKFFYFTSVTAERSRFSIFLNVLLFPAD